MVALQRVGSSVNFIVTPILADEGVPMSVWFGTGVCVLSVVACAAAWGLDSYGEKRIVRERDEDGNVKEETSDPVEISEIRHFPLAAWLIFAICAFFYVGFLTFQSVASDIMQNTGGKYDDNTATLFLSIPSFISVLSSPLFGAIVDKNGRGLSIVLVSCVMMVVTHVVFLANALGWVFLWPPIVFVWLGFAYSLGASSIWPILSYCIDNRMLGTGYGLMTAIQNLFLAVFPLIVGSIQDSYPKTDVRKYSLPLLIFICCGGVAMALTVVLIAVDKARHGGMLNASAAARKVIIDRLAREDKDKAKAREAGGESDVSVEAAETIAPAIAARMPLVKNRQDSHVF